MDLRGCFLFFYCLKFSQSFRTENKLKCQEKVCKNKDFCLIVLPSIKDNILELNQYNKSDEIDTLFILISNFWLKAIDGCANNLENFSATNIGGHIPCGYSMATIWAFDKIEKIVYLILLRRL